MPSITDLLTTHRPSLDLYEDLYRHLHAHPELSFAESRTATKIASVLASLSPDFALHAHIGGHGLAAVLRNPAPSPGSSNPPTPAPAPTVLLRADIDALPVLERTGLPYASTATQPDPADAGTVKPVMHACGHDMHITSLLAAADLLVRAREAWQGTLVLVFQPAEERGAGARAMVEGGLYEKVPVPDVVVGGHVMPFRAGRVGTRRGLVAGSADSVGITLHGRQGHSSQPHRTIDPILLVSSTILRLHTIVSREIDPQTPAVVSVTSLHAGSAHNIIPETAHLKVNIRNYDAASRSQVLAAMHRIVDAECAASASPAQAEWTDIATYPLTFNDEGVTGALEESFAAHFGGEYDANAALLGGSEDFAILATAVGRPSCFFTYGGVDHEVWDEAERKGTTKEAIPVNHSPFFAPVVQPTLTAAVDAYAVAALTWLRKKD